MSLRELPYDPRKRPDRNLKVPDLTEAVEGWRAWRIVLELPPFGVSPKLHSVNDSFYWMPCQVAIAECDGRCKEDDIPGEACSCGLYSAKSFEHLMTLHYHLYDGENGFCVVGQVANWGKVVEGSLGWRAQYSYPVKLFVPFEANHLAKPLSKAYGVPVVLRNFLKPLDFPHRLH